MRKSLLPTAILMMAALAGPIYADNYSITLYDPTIPTQVDGTGSLTSTGSWFPTFTVSWAGLTFDLVAGGINYLFDLDYANASDALEALTDNPWYGPPFRGLGLIGLSPQHKYHPWRARRRRVRLRRFSQSTNRGL